MLTRQERARQFLPFDALTGLREALKKNEKAIYQFVEKTAWKALKKKEIEQEDKILLSEESEEYLSECLNELSIEDYIEVKYYNYSLKRYVSYKGYVKKIDNVKKKIIFEGEIKISIADIIDIKHL